MSSALTSSQSQAEHVRTEYAERAAVNVEAANVWLLENFEGLFRRAVSKAEPMAAVESFNVLMELAFPQEEEHCVRNCC